ncbi:unnamed protein product [Meloidogyne enterolobii]|uniref:Uncharacterized protein n=1 Tax=Meloidogyne enterolobii TaxID=390850 RepID=A0ACB1ABD2_MELEN
MLNVICMFVDPFGFIEVEFWKKELVVLLLWLWLLDYCKGFELKGGFKMETFKTVKTVWIKLGMPKLELEPGPTAGTEFWA